MSSASRPMKYVPLLLGVACIDICWALTKLQCLVFWKFCCSTVARKLWSLWCRHSHYHHHTEVRKLRHLLTSSSFIGQQSLNVSSVVPWIMWFSTYYIASEVSFFACYRRLNLIGLIFQKFLQLSMGSGLKKKKLRGFGPLTNHADRATAASWRSSTNFCG
jgi:hypothetical protein